MKELEKLTTDLLKILISYIFPEPNRPRERKLDKNGGYRVAEGQEQAFATNKHTNHTLKLCLEQGKEKENAENSKRKKPIC